MSPFTRWTLAFAAAFVLALVVVRTQVGWVYRIPSDSMAPGLVAGNIVWVRYDTAAPVPGEVVLVRDPRHEDRVLVKRVVATSGHTLAIDDGAVAPDGTADVLHTGVTVIVDGACARHEVATRREVLPDGTRNAHVVDLNLGTWLRDQPEVTVPAGQVYLLGDNRDHSLDSRSFGPVPLELVLGRVAGVVWAHDACGGL